MGKKPIFGICLGHQVLGFAFGGKTFKLKFGHRGGNQPVKDLRTRQSGDHVAESRFCGRCRFACRQKMEVTHINLNDGTVEGMRHRELPIFSVQYHPEAAPGPHDASYFFSQFAELIEKGGNWSTRIDRRRNRADVPAMIYSNSEVPHVIVELAVAAAFFRLRLVTRLAMRARARKRKTRRGGEKTVTGEIVDMMCYVDHNAMGENTRLARPNASRAADRSAS